MGKCIYCSSELTEASIIDFCDRCGINAFGAKMFKTICDNMSEAQVRGDLDQI